MRIGLCCCAGNPTPEAGCPVPPTGFSARNYRISFPKMYPLSLGRKDPPYVGDTYDQGRCASTSSSPAWSVPVCDYYNEIYLYDTLYSACNQLNVPFCYEAYGPSEFFAPAADWDFTGASLIAPPFGNANIEKNFGDFTNWLVECDFQRCENVSLINRSWLRVIFNYDYVVTRRLCGNASGGGPPRERKAQCVYEATYWGDPFTAAEGISPILYLKSFRHISPRYCGDAEGYWATYVNGFENPRGYGANGSYLQPGSYPGLMPSTLEVKLR